MKLKSISFAALLCSPLLLAFQPHGTKLEFSAQEGSSSSKTFTNKLSMTLDDLSMLMNGQASPVTPQIEMTIESTLEVSVTDTYVKMSGGTPAKLQRTYDTLGQSRAMEMEMEVMGQVTNSDSDAGSTTELEGATVDFTWDSDVGEFVLSFPDDDGDEDLLVGLTENMDLRGLLPDDEVSEGDEWTVEPLVLADLLTPGGNLKFIPEDTGAEDMMGMDSEMGDFNEWFSDDVDGEFTATFTGTKEADDGTEVAVITFLFEITNAVDLTEKMQEGLEDADLPPEAGDMEINSLDMEIDLEGEGTLLWNVKTGSAHSFELSAELGLLVDIDMSVSAGGMDMDIEQSLEFSGTMGSTATFE